MQKAAEGAIALSKQGHYEWETFRQRLIATIGEWEATHDLADPEWDYYQYWLVTLEKLVIESGVIDGGELEAAIAQLVDCKETPN